MRSVYILFNVLFSCRRSVVSNCARLILIYLLFFSFDAPAQGPLKPVWDYRYGGDSADGSTCLIRTMDGGYGIAGYSKSGATGDKSQSSQGRFDYWMVKTDSSGIMQYNFRFGGLNDDLLTCLLQTADGGYLLGGFSNSGSGGDRTQNSRGIYDYWIVKTDAAGNKLWDRRFGGNDYDQLYDLKQTADGGYLLGGWTASTATGDVTDTARGEKDYWIVRTDAAGTKLWDRRYGGTASDIFYRMASLNDGGFLLCGSSSSDSSGEKTQNSRGSSDFWILRIDSSGNQLWDRRFGASGIEFLAGMEHTYDYGFVLGGWSDSPADGDKTDNCNGAIDFWIVKIDSGGNKLWDKGFGGTAIEDDFGNVFETTDSGIVVTGTSYSNTSGDKSENNLGIEQGWMIKTDSSGNILWDKTIFTNGHDESALSIQAPDGCFIISVPTQSGIGGYKSQDSRGVNDFWILKLCDSTLMPVAGFIATDIQICPGTCIDFTNYSINAGTYEWTFPGGNPPASTDSFPTGICYANPGTYDAILVAHNYFSSDTLLLQHYITVFPQPPPQSITLVNDTLYSNPGFVYYQWYFNGNAINGATDYYYYAQAGGDYNVVCGDSNGCELEAVIFNVLTGTSGNSAGMAIQLFPNPAAEYVHLKFYGSSSSLGSGDIIVSVFDLTGKQVFSVTEDVRSLVFLPAENEFVLYLGTLREGIYWIQAAIGNQVVRTRFVRTAFE